MCYRPPQMFGCMLTLARWSLNNVNASPGGSVADAKLGPNGNPAPLTEPPPLVQGVQYLVDNGLLEHRADSVAQFLYKEEGLNKSAIGSFLGEKYRAGESARSHRRFWARSRSCRFCCRDELNLLTLKVFVGLHEFSDLNLVQALRSESPPTPSFRERLPESLFLVIVPFVSRRQFLWSFRLPGEAQKIDRMMEAFATRYCECNPGVFQSTGRRTLRAGRTCLRPDVTVFSGTDTCYILSFAVVMLNTTLHNPNVRDKPSLQRFVSMNRGINNGEDLPTETLTVRQHPSEPSDHALIFALRPAETLRQHPQRAAQGPRGRRQRPHADVLQPRPRRLAPQNG